LTFGNRGKPMLVWVPGARGDLTLVLDTFDQFFDTGQLDRQQFKFIVESRCIPIANFYKIEYSTIIARWQRQWGVGRKILSVLCNSIKLLVFAITHKIIVIPLPQREEVVLVRWLNKFRDVYWGSANFDSKSAQSLGLFTGLADMNSNLSAPQIIRSVVIDLFQNQNNRFSPTPPNPLKRYHYGAV